MLSNRISPTNEKETQGLLGAESKNYKLDLPLDKSNAQGELKTNSVDDNKNESSKHIEEKSHSEVQTPNVSLTDIITDFKQEENTSARKGNPKHEDVSIKDIAKQILSADLESLGKNMNEKSQSIGEK